MNVISFDFPVKKLAKTLETSEVYAGAETAPCIIRKRVTGYQAVHQGRVFYRSKYLDHVVLRIMHEYNSDRIHFRTTQHC